MKSAGGKGSDKVNLLIRNREKMINKNELAPVALFVYNRPWHTEQTLNALRRNRWIEDSVLYIYADGAKIGAEAEELNRINEVRKLIAEINWCREAIVIENDENLGLADSITRGVTHVVNKHDKVIVLEDDIVTSPGFLQFMNEALVIYAEEDRVMHISGYKLPSRRTLPNTFFYNVTSCWGWATWSNSWAFFNKDATHLFQELNKKNDWNKFDLDNSYPFSQDLKSNINGTMRTWAVKWYASVFLVNGLCLHPGKTLVRNIGHDGSGVHCGDNDSFNKQDIAEFIFQEKIKLEENLFARKAFKEFYLNQNKISLRERFKKMIKNFL